MKNEQKFILECVHAFLGDCNNEKLETLYGSIDHQKLNLLIRQQNLEGFFYYLYLNKKFNMINIPDHTIALWKKVAGKNSLSNAINDNEAFEIVSLLDENKIDYIYIKGLAIRRQIYNCDYLKCSTDIDIFIKKTDYPKVKNILLSNDYEIPYDYYIKAGIKIPFKEYEKRANEISFIKKQSGLRFIIDLQWDFTFSNEISIFHSLYGINSIYEFDTTEMIEIKGYKIKVFPLEIAFINLAFHFAFNHGFMSIQRLIDICQFIKKYETQIDFDLIKKIASTNLKKILGIILMLSCEFNHEPAMDKEQKKLFYLDRLLPFEYGLYKSMVFKLNITFFDKIALRLITILLPYKVRDHFRVSKYLFFNTDSISQRLDPAKKAKKILLPFSLFKLLISDIIKGKGR